MKTKYSKELLFSVIPSCYSLRDVLRSLGLKLTGGSHSHIKKLISRFEIDTSHFLGQSKKTGQQCNKNKKHWSEILVINKADYRRPGYLLSRALIESGRKYECIKCKNIGLWFGEKLFLEVDHVNNIFTDNRSENLQFLCPNCHDQKTRKTPKPRKVHVTATWKWFCQKCGKKVYRKNFSCKSCVSKKTKIIWTDTPNLIKMVENSSYLAVAKKLGVSDNAVRKRIKNHP